MTEGYSLECVSYCCTQPESDRSHGRGLEFMFPFVAQIAAHHGVSLFPQFISSVA